MANKTYQYLLTGKSAVGDWTCAGIVQCQWHQVQDFIMVDTLKQLPPGGCPFDIQELTIIQKGGEKQWS